MEEGIDYNKLTFETYVDIASFLNTRDKTIEFAIKLIEEVISTYRKNNEFYSAIVEAPNGKMFNIDYNFVWHTFLLWISETTDLKKEKLQRINNMFSETESYEGGIHYFLNVLLEIYGIRVTVNTKYLTMKVVYKNLITGSYFTFDSIGLSAKGLNLLVGENLVEANLRKAMLNKDTVDQIGYGKGVKSILNNAKMTIGKVYSVGDFKDFDFLNI